MSTLSQIRVRIARKLKDESYTDLSAATIDAEINRSIRHYKNKQFWFNDEIASITLTANTQAVPSIPSDLLYPTQVNALLVIDGQSKFNLEKLLPDEFKERDEDQVGLPEYWTYVDGSYLLLPTPDSAYTIKLRYIKTYSDLSGDSAENDFTNNLEDLIMLHTLKNIFAEDKQDQTYAAMYADLEKIELDMIERRTSALNATGKIRIDTIL